MRGLWTVFKKEMLDNLRDKRALRNAFLFGALLPPLLIVALSYMSYTRIKAEIEKAENDLELPVLGQEYAPNLINFINDNGVAISQAPEDYLSLIKRKDVEAVLVIPEDFAEHWRAGRPAPIDLVADHSRRYIQITLNRLATVLNTYSQQIGRKRLELRGVSPDLKDPVFVKQVDISTAFARGAEQIMSLLPYFLLMGAFIGGMYIAIDTTAGEKERRSLEPLLLNPAPRWHFMGGKLLATTVYTTISLAFSLVVFKLILPRLPLAELGIKLNMDMLFLLKTFILILPVALIGSALLTIIAAHAKGFREAQSAVSSVILIPMLPSLYLMISPVKPEFWMTTVPLLSQNVLLMELARAEPVPVSWLASAFFSSLALGLVLAAIAAFLYNRPTIIFGK